MEQTARGEDSMSSGSEDDEDREREEFYDSASDSDEEYGCYGGEEDSDASDGESLSEAHGSYSGDDAQGSHDQSLSQVQWGCDPRPFTRILYQYPTDIDRPIDINRQIDRNRPIVYR